MKYSPNPDSSCWWFSLACSSLGMAGGFVLARVSEFTIPLMVGIALLLSCFCCARSVAAEKREEEQEPSLRKRLDDSLKERDEARERGKKEREGAMHSSECWELMHAKRHEELEVMTADRDALIRRVAELEAALAGDLHGESESQPTE